MKAHVMVRNTIDEDRLNDTIEIICETDEEPSKLKDGKVHYEVADRMRLDLLALLQTQDKGEVESLEAILPCTIVEVETTGSPDIDKPPVIRLTLHATLYAFIPLHDPHKWKMDRFLKAVGREKLPDDLNDLTNDELKVLIELISFQGVTRAHVRDFVH